MDIDSPIIITFSESMEPNSITPSSFTVAEMDGIEPESGTITFTDENKTAIFTPSTLLKEGTVYLVTVTTDVRNVMGISMSESFTSYFVTAYPPLTVLNIIPENDR